METLKVLVRTGCFDYCHPGQKMVAVWVELPADAPGKRILEWSWPVDDAPDEIERIPPSELVELIDRALVRYIVGNRSDRLAIHAWCRANRGRLDAAWARGRIASLEKRIAELQRDIHDLRHEHLLIEDE